MNWQQLQSIIVQCQHFVHRCNLFRLLLIMTVYSVYSQYISVYQTQWKSCLWIPSVYYCIPKHKLANWLWPGNTESWEDLTKSLSVIVNSVVHRNSVWALFYVTYFLFTGHPLSCVDNNCNNEMKHMAKGSVSQYLPPSLCTWHVAMVVGRGWQGCISLRSWYPDIILHELSGIKR